MKVIQILPELNEGGVERGVVELNRELVLKGIDSFVISAGGKLEPQIGKEGGEHIKFDVCSKNIFTFFSRVALDSSRKLTTEASPCLLRASFFISFCSSIFSFSMVIRRYIIPPVKARHMVIKKARMRRVLMLINHPPWISNCRRILYPD